MSATLKIKNAADWLIKSISQKLEQAKAEGERDGFASASKHIRELEGRVLDAEAEVVKEVLEMVEKLEEKEGATPIAWILFRNQIKKKYDVQE